MNKKHEVQADSPVLARNFAISRGLRVSQVIRYCESGKIPGARFDRVLWQWVLYPPIKLIR